MNKKKKKCCSNLKAKIEKKLFYSSFYRYMIISNLKLTVTMWGFLLASWSFDTFSKGASSIGYTIGILLLLVWPLFIMIFLEIK